MIDKEVERAYKDQIRRCKRKVDVLGNPVEMRMSLQQFADKWDQSGHWDDRGCRRGQYVMARHNDIGHYEWDNVSIILHSENIRAAHLGRKRSAETCAKNSAARKGKPSPLKGRPAHNKGKPSPLKGRPAHNKGKPAHNKGIPMLEEQKVKMRKPKPKIQCPHCGMWGGSNAMKRYHFDNCKAAPK